VPPLERVTFRANPEVEEACVKKNKPVPALPNQQLLTIRAACSRVAHLSGAAEQADKILREMEDTTVLADDGSMGDLLSSRLSMVLPRDIDVHG
jgi:hypothetical protein